MSRHPFTALAATVALVTSTMAGLLVGTPASGAAPDVNPAPAVVPSLQQWTGGVGQFTFGPQSRIVVADPGLAGDAGNFAADLRSLAGLDLPVVADRPSHAGDIVVGLGATGLPAQGYTLAIGDMVTISGADSTGAFYGEQTVEQMVALDPSHDTLTAARTARRGAASRGVAH